MECSRVGTRIGTGQGRMRHNKGEAVKRALKAAPARVSKGLATLWAYLCVEIHLSKKYSLYQLHTNISGGWGGIRTHERLLTPAGFQDRCLKPLGHPSVLVRPSGAGARIGIRRRISNAPRERGRADWPFKGHRKARLLERPPPRAHAMLESRGAVTAEAPNPTLAGPSEAPLPWWRGFPNSGAYRGLARTSRL